MLPGLRYAVEHRHARLLRIMREFYVEAFRRLEHRLDLIERALG